MMCQIEKFGTNIKSSIQRIKINELLMDNSFLAQISSNLPRPVNKRAKLKLGQVTQPPLFTPLIYTPSLHS